MGFISTQAVSVPSPEVEKTEQVQPAPQPERKEGLFVIKVASSIPT
jgi:hypothetical protein